MMTIKAGTTVMTGMLADIEYFDDEVIFKFAIRPGYNDFLIQASYPVPGESMLNALKQLGANMKDMTVDFNRKEIKKNLTPRSEPVNAPGGGPAKNKPRIVSSTPRV